ncbi:MAG: NfeD family protein [Coriobacteriia bacterium]|nr:NfeD family protein [Coriobacteriia bacterium]
MDVWFWVWAALAAVLIVGEMFTAGFFLLPFGIGAAAAAAADYFGLALGWQWAAFLVVSIALLFGLRNFADRVTHEPPEKTGVDRLIGKIGVVTEGIEPGDGAGRIRIEREEWRADSPVETFIPIGARVLIERIEGTHLVVTPVEETATKGD